MRRFYLFLFAIGCGLGALGILGIRELAAEPGPDAAVLARDAAPSIVDAAPAPPAVTVTTTITAEQLHDPLTNPLAAWSDLEALQRAGWPLLALGVLLMVTHLIARAPGAVGAWFATGLRATIIAGVGGVAVAAFHALAIGGTWASVAFAAGGAGLALFMPTPSPPRPQFTALGERICPRCGGGVEPGAAGRLAHVACSKSEAVP